MRIFYENYEIFAATAWGLGCRGPARRSALAHTHKKGGGLQVLTQGQNLTNGICNDSCDAFDRSDSMRYVRSNITLWANCGSGSFVLQCNKNFVQCAKFSPLGMETHLGKKLVKNRRLDDFDRRKFA